MKHFVTGYDPENEEMYYSGSYCKTHDKEYTGDHCEDCIDEYLDEVRQELPDELDGLESYIIERCYTEGLTVDQAVQRLKLSI